MVMQVVKEKLEVPLFKQNFQKWEEEEFKSTFETAKEATGRKETPEVGLLGHLWSIVLVEWAVVALKIGCN